MSAASTSKSWYSIAFNIGGTSFRVLKARLLEYPHTRLGELAASDNPGSLCDEVLLDSQGNTQYFFDRSWHEFGCILNLYRKNTVHCPENMVCPQDFIEELDYWKIPRTFMAQCCASKLPQPTQTLVTANGPDSSTSIDRNTLLEVDEEPDDEKCLKEINSWEQTRARMNAFLDDPASSKAAGIFMVVSVTFVIITIWALILGSIPYFQRIDPKFNTTEAIWEIEIADTVCVVYFTAEYVLRLIASPDRPAYVKSIFSIVDVLAIAPFYVELIFTHAGIKSGTLYDFKRTMVVMRILRVLRVLRVLRILKVARYSTGFQSFVGAFVKSWRELSMMGMFVLTINILFSTVIYFAEYEEPGSKFYSIPQASWWCIITMTTVGYGDLYPTTVIGKMVACLASITGIILLAFPISIVVENFNELNCNSPEDNNNNPDHHEIKLVHGKFGVTKVRRKSQSPRD